MRTDFGSMVISNVRFACDREADVAVALIGPDLKNGGIDEIKTVPVSKPSADYIATPVGLFIGHPATANRIDSRSTRREFKLFSISGHRVEAPKSTSKLRRPIYYDFKRNDMTPGLNRSPQSRSAPEPHGMSGGPVLQVFISPKNEELQACINGVAVEWDRTGSYLIAADICDVWSLLAEVAPTEV